MFSRVFISIVSAVLFTTSLSSAQEREKYAESSAAYAKGREDFYPEAVMEAMEPFLNPSDLILDVACGTGLGTRKLCEQGYKNIVGVDYDSKMIEQAELANTEECPIKYVVADVQESLPFASNYFDVITTFNAFHQYANNKSMQEISRVLKSSGTFVIVTKNQIDDPIKREVQRIMLEKEKHSDKLDTVAFLNQNGFTVISQKSLNFEHIYDREKYLDYALFSSSKWNEFRNTSQGEEIVKKVNHYLDTVADSKGQIKEQREVLIIAAKKQPGADRP